MRNAAAKIIKKVSAVTLIQSPKVHSNAYWQIAQELECPAVHVSRLLKACITLQHFLDSELKAGKRYSQDVELFVDNFIIVGVVSKILV